jgi:CHAT domain-containing protein
MQSLDNAAFYQSIQQQKFPLSFRKLLEFQGTQATTQKDSANIARTLPIMHFYYQSNATPTTSRSHIAVKKSAVDANKMAKEEKAALSHLLYNIYLQPFEQVLQGKKTIYICGDFLQHFIPFETLLMPDGRYLVEQYNIIYVPSFTIHESLGKREYNPGSKIIAAGNPDYTTYHPENLQGRAYDFSYLGIKSWADLPGTEKELQTLGQTFDSIQVISQGQLSERLLKTMSQNGELKKAAILHFALHGIAGTASAKEDNSLAVTEPDGGKEDGLLQFYEAYELDIKPQLVCLSACETAIGMMETDGTVTTMGTAFLAAGAKAVLATNWSIDDEATALFMKELYTEIKTKKASIAEAAANTKRKFIRGDFGERFKDPFFWAPFKYIGN